MLHWFHFQADIDSLLYLTFQEFPVCFCQCNSFCFGCVFEAGCNRLLRQGLVYDAGDGLLSLPFQERAMVSLDDVNRYLPITHLRGNTRVSRGPTRRQHCDSVCFRYFMLSGNHNIDCSISRVRFTGTIPSTPCSTSFSL